MMTKTIFLFSGEGTSHKENTSGLIEYSSLWVTIGERLRALHDLDLDDIWRGAIGTHRGAYGPLLTVVTEICLSDLWIRWGYRPDAVLGHSTGELAAAFRAGFYTLDEVISLALLIGRAGAELDGVMMHGTVPRSDLDTLKVHVSSVNFSDPTDVHVTVSGYAPEMAAFRGDHPDFTVMKPGHPWHHPDYAEFCGLLKQVPSGAGGSCEFVSGITGRFEARLAADYWARWLTHPVNFVDAMNAVRERYGDGRYTVIEIGFHPVLDRACDALGDVSYASSMFRGEEEIPWIMHQRRLCDPEPFRAALKDALARFTPALDFETSLAYQGLTSLKFVELTGVLQDLFPSLKPQDFYRFKTIDQLIRGFGHFGRDTTLETRSVMKHRVVICGMSCRFPRDVENPAAFWDVLMKKADQVGANAARGSREAGYLGDTVSRFDHTYFGIPQAEAATMDPQQILALELTELLWRDAGIDPATLDRKRVGVYIGVWNQEFGGDERSVFHPVGTNPSVVASRISYHYDLRGPSWVVNTACSSSLVAMHYAARDIEDGRVDYAIAGGVNMILGNRFTDIMGNSGFLSRENRCKTFDSSADGYVRAEGGGLVLMANQSLAGRYYAEMPGSSVNQNGGRSQVITAPHPEAQEDLILEACRDAGISPLDIDYVECHGTGTKIGDPIEVTAIQNTIARNRDRVCYLGSVKSNIGHLESAAGIAGVIKALLVFQHGAIPPDLHFNTPNPFVDFDSYRLKVVSEETPVSREALVGISSFGFGGANAHVILKGAESPFRKEAGPFVNPFDRNRAVPVTGYAEREATSPVAPPSKQDDRRTSGDVRTFVRELFFRLTGIETVDPDIPLFEQGLDSLGAAELINAIETEYGLNLDPDILFDVPMIDGFVRAIEEKCKESGGVDGNVSRSDVADLVARLFTQLTTYETLDPAVELVEQGLTSLSMAELVSQVETAYGISLDPDIIFECPFFDQLVDKIHSLVK